MCVIVTDDDDVVVFCVWRGNEEPIYVGVSNKNRYHGTP